VVGRQTLDDLRPEAVIAQKGVSAAENQTPFFKKRVHAGSACERILNEVQ
jgi:hypothetical protein